MKSFCCDQREMTTKSDPDEKSWRSEYQITLELQVDFYSFRPTVWKSGAQGNNVWLHQCSQRILKLMNIQNENSHLCMMCRKQQRDAEESWYPFHQAIRRTFWDEDLQFFPEEVLRIWLPKYERIPRPSETKSVHSHISMIDLLKRAMKCTVCSSLASSRQRWLNFSGSRIIFSTIAAKEERKRKRKYEYSLSQNNSYF